jgi:hypothetical protein
MTRDMKFLIKLSHREIHIEIEHTSTINDLKNAIYAKNYYLSNKKFFLKKHLVSERLTNNIILYDLVVSINPPEINQSGEYMLWGEFYKTEQCNIM